MRNMKKLKNYESEVNKLIPAVGFIKTRKLESVVMDMAEKLHMEAKKKRYLILETCVDRDGSRDIDRQQLDEIYEFMKLESFHDLFIRNMDDIATSFEKQLAFARYTDDHDMNIHVIDVTPETGREIWDGGAGC